MVKIRLHDALLYARKIGMLNKSTPKLFKGLYVAALVLG